MNLISQEFIKIIVSLIIFLALFAVARVIYGRFDRSDSRLLNLNEYLPIEEILTLRQVCNLIMMLLLFILILYLLIYTNDDVVLFAVIDVLVSLHLLIRIEYNTWKRKIAMLLLLPIGSITFLVFGYSIADVLDIIHAPIFLYFMKVYYDKFREYTETNGLGITIVLLFAIIFVSFIITMIVEGVQPLDSLVMVSNAFTSNGYTILGSTPMGKLNSLFLVWGGYLLSGVGTATLTAAIITRYFNKKFEEMEELIKENKK